MWTRKIYWLPPILTFSVMLGVLTVMTRDPLPANQTELNWPAPSPWKMVGTGWVYQEH